MNEKENTDMTFGIFVEVFHDTDWHNASPLSYEFISDYPEAIPLCESSRYGGTTIHYSLTGECSGSIDRLPLNQTDFLQNLSAVIYKDSPYLDEQTKQKDEVVHLNLSKEVLNAVTSLSNNESGYTCEMLPFSELWVCTLENWREFLEHNMSMDKCYVAENVFNTIIRRVKRFHIVNGLGEFDENNVRVIIKLFDNPADTFYARRMEVKYKAAVEKYVQNDEAECYLEDSETDMYEETDVLDIDNEINVDTETINIYCPGCKFAGHTYIYTRALYGGSRCEKCDDISMFRIPDPLFNAIKVLDSKNYIFIDCDYLDEETESKKTPYISISFLGQINFPFVPANIAVVQKEYELVEIDITTIFLYDNRISGEPNTIKKKMLAYAVKILDWAISLPKLEEREFICTYNASENMGLYYSLSVDELVNRLEIKD